MPFSVLLFPLYYSFSLNRSIGPQCKVFSIGNSLIFYPFDIFSEMVTKGYGKIACFRNLSVQRRDIVFCID